MKKHYLLDTNVLLHDPAALFQFQENDVYLPLEVVVELDRFKKGSDEINVNAREVIRNLEELTKEGIPSEGISLERGGKLFFLLPPEQKKRKKRTASEQGLFERVDRGVSILENKLGYADDRILAWAKTLAQDDPKTYTCLVTKDLNLRLRARILGMHAEDYRHDKAAIDLHALFGREREIVVVKDLIDTIYQQREKGVEAPPELRKCLDHNQYIVLRGESRSALVKYVQEKLVAIRDLSSGIEGIKPRNYSQRFLFDACLDQNFTILTALGKAGTGKTVVTLAAALHQVMKGNDRRYDKVVVFRPILETGKELGYLPGEVEDKIAPHFGPIKTALRIILGDAGVEYQGLDDYIEYRPINFVRGDTLHKSFIVVDEAQNFTHRELKLIGTRMGEGSKIVFLGDPFQIDNPYLDEKSNGLTVITDRLRNKAPEFTYVLLEKVERSRVAEIFANYV